MINLISLHLIITGFSGIVMITSNRYVIRQRKLLLNYSLQIYKKKAELVKYI